MNTYNEIHFPAVSPVTAKRRVTCPGCGKKRTIQRTFTQTVNPFNKHPDGTVKTFDEVTKAAWEEAGNWEPSPISLWHDACWES